jgi:peptidoglycan/xylan/chitin deacetylase (PgdA/CDA1 family)
VRFVSPLLKRVVYPCLSGAGYLRGLSKPGLAVVTYHGVFPKNFKPIDHGFDGSLITADTFRRQLRLLKKNYNVISPEQMLAWCRNEGELPPRAVLLTCDDGFLNNLTEMLPVLQEEQLRCLFFVTGVSAGRQRTMLWYENLLLMFLRARAGDFAISFDGIEISGTLRHREQRRLEWWSAVNRLSKIDSESRTRFIAAAYSYFELQDSLEFYLSTYEETQRHFCLLTCSELQELDKAGMTIGAHTVTHPVLSQLPAELAWNEITESRARLESVLGKKVWAFAYPFGDEASVSPRVLAMAKQAGFDAAFMNVGGGLGTELPVYALPRVHVNQDVSLAEFEAHVSGFYEDLQRSLRRKPQPSNPMPKALPDSHLSPS